MATLSRELKRKVADIYLQNKQKLETYSSDAMESFASEMLKIVGNEKRAI